MRRNEYWGYDLPMTISNIREKYIIFCRLQPEASYAGIWVEGVPRSP